jgi:hydrogenase maturation protein HypF
MAREPRLSAFSLAHASSAELSLVLPNFRQEEQDYYQKVLRRSSLNTSSMGRLFDAVASLLGICHINSYEGEAAMYMEVLAKAYCRTTVGYPAAYEFELLQNGSITYGKIINTIIDQIHQGCDKGLIAATFHRTVVEMVRKVAEFQQAKHLVFSGGVMQNSLLVDMVIDLLGADFQLFFHKQLSPNDECIAYGQLVAYYAGKAIGPVLGDFLPNK